MRLIAILVRLMRSQRIYFIYWDEATHRNRLYFDKADRDIRDGFFSLPWFGREPYEYRR